MGQATKPAKLGPEVKLGNFGGLAEIYQAVETKFAFISPPKEGNAQCNSFAKCRDFLHDMVKTHLIKGKMSLYGLAYEFGKHPKLDTRLLRMAVYHDKTKKGAKEIEKFEAEVRQGVAYVNHYEQLAGLKRRTTMVRAANKDKAIWILTGPSFWLKAPYLVSMFTMLIRLGDKSVKFSNTEELVAGFKKIANNAAGGDNDAKYLKACHDKMHLVVTNAKTLFWSKGTWYPSYYNKDINIGTFHNNGGIWSLCNYNTFDQDLNKQFKALVEAKKK